MNFYDEMLKHVKATSTYQLGRGTTEAAGCLHISLRPGGFKAHWTRCKGTHLAIFWHENLKLRRISLNDMNHDKRHISERFWRKKKQKFLIYLLRTHPRHPTNIPRHEVEIPHPGGSNLTQRRGLRSLLDREVMGM